MLQKSTKRDTRYGTALILANIIMYPLVLDYSHMNWAKRLQRTLFRKVTYPYETLDIRTKWKFLESVRSTRGHYSMSLNTLTEV